MTKIEHIGKLPVNSRITIDYTKPDPNTNKPPLIEFGYPDKDSSVVRKSDATFLIAIFFAVVMILILVFIFFNFIQPTFYPHTTTFDTKINNVIVSNYTYLNGTSFGFNAIYVNYTWNDQIYSSRITLKRAGTIWIVPYLYGGYSSDVLTLLKLIAGYFILIALFFVLILLNSYWIAAVFKNTRWGNKKFPELNKKLHDARFSAEFLPQDFPVDKNIIEIPLFKNMYMDYEAIGDYAEQLQKISIIEHPFNRLVKKGLPSKKRKNIIKKPNVYLWKCVVEFKNKPKDGQLILRWS